MVRNVLFTILGSGILAGCGGSTGAHPAPLDSSAAAKPPVKKDYFPVFSYLQGEMAAVDSTPYRIMLFRTRDHRTDSTLVAAGGFDSLARPFLNPDLEKSRMEALFSESSFLDETSQSLTFTYRRQGGGSGLQRVDVLATPDLGLDKVKSIYLEETGGTGDSLWIRKMFWKANRRLEVITLRQQGTQPGTTSRYQVVWDNRP